MSCESKQEVRARATGKNEYGCTELLVEFDSSVLGNYNYVFSGVIAAHCHVSDSFETAYGMKLVFLPLLGAELDEMRAATKKLEAMTRRMEAQRKELGSPTTFAEFARRAIVAANATKVYVARKFNAPCRVDEISPLGPKQGSDILYAIGELEKTALALYAKKAA